MESKITQKCNFSVFSGRNFKRKNRLNHLFSHTAGGIIETLSRIIYTVALKCCFSYFGQPTENPRWKLWEHFCICKIIIVNRKVLQIWKLWPQFICLYFGISQFNWEDEKLLLNFHSTKFSFNKSFNKHKKVSWRCYIIPLLFIMNPSFPSVNTRGNCLAR